MTTRPAATERVPPWQPIVEVATALAASVVYLYIAGGLVIWARLRAVDLPADTVVAELPREFLLTTGLTSLIIPVLIIGGATAVVAWRGYRSENREAGARDNSLFGLFAAALGVAVAIEGDPSPTELVIGGALLLGAVGLTLLLKDRRPPEGDRRGQVGAALKAAVPSMVFLAYAAFFLSPDLWLLGLSLVVLILVLPLSWWAERARSTRGLMVRVLLITALLGLVFRVASEFDAPSPFYPALVYADSTGTCRSDAAQGPAEAPCVLAGYVIGETDDTVYLAEPSQVAVTLRELRILAEVSGQVAELPMDGIKEIRSTRSLQVKKTGQEGEVSNLEEVLGPDEEPADGNSAAGPSSTDVGAAGPSSTDVVRRFAPLVWLHSEDQSGPGDPVHFINGSALIWRRESGKDKPLAPRNQVRAARLGERCDGDPNGCYSYGDYLAPQLTRPFEESAERPESLAVEDGLYLDLEDSLRRGERTLRPKAPVFYERGGEAELRITYWLFYPYSRVDARAGRRDASRFVSHEGDWENIDVILTPGLKPLRVVFYGHGQPTVHPWSSICKVVETREDCVSDAPGHPIVYSAKGTHASYPNQNDSKNDDSRVCTKKRILVFKVKACSYDLRDRGRPWKTWVKLVDDAKVQPWYGYGGAWGAAANKTTTGPLGPSRYKRKDDAGPAELVPVSNAK